MLPQHGQNRLCLLLVELYEEINDTSEMRVLGLPNFMQAAIVAVSWIPFAGFDNVLWRRHCHFCVVAVTRKDIQDVVAR